MPTGAGGTGNIDNIIQPFVLDTSRFHGRLVRLGSAVDDIIDRHDYPDPVAAVLAQSVALTSALAAALKFDGVFNLQLSGDGPVKFLVSDVTNAGDLRGYAGLRGDIPGGDAVDRAPIPHLFGNGYLSFTVDQGVHTERYQGIVDLSGATLQDCVHHYFQQSDQFSAAVKLHGGRDASGRWRAGAMMLQRSPETEDPNFQEPTEEAWRSSLIMLSSCTDSELIDPEISAHNLLFRLFNEDGVRVFDTRDLRFACRCSEGKVEQVLRSLSEAELAELVVDDRVTVTCEFCNEERAYDANQLAQLRAS